ncbi:unnamed protein product [Effrenium voratum]|uniref:Uncharacterized protein n=1 Tax=Effrenium voratum TaxID=2562239 RepID=A0AA36IAX9_9DINO|nr:unnamed protein product [Effrenium voratum]CAJ1413270.1 unnamed protein product [Effrenium voratum]
MAVKRQRTTDFLSAGEEFLEEAYEEAERKKQFAAKAREWRAVAQAPPSLAPTNLPRLEQLAPTVPAMAPATPSDAEEDEQELERQREEQERQRIKDQCNQWFDEELAKNPLRPEHKTLLAERLQAEDQEYYRKKWLLQVHAEEQKRLREAKQAEDAAKELLEDSAEESSYDSQDGDMEKEVRRMLAPIQTKQEGRTIHNVGENICNAFAKGKVDHHTIQQEICAMMEKKDQQQIVRTALFYVLHEIAKKLKGRQGISQLVLNVLLTMQEMKTMAADERRHYADFIFKPPSKIQGARPPSHFVELEASEEDWLETLRSWERRMRTAAAPAVPTAPPASAASAPKPSQAPEFTEAQVKRHLLLNMKNEL